MHTADTKKKTSEGKPHKRARETVFFFNESNFYKLLREKNVRIITNFCLLFLLNEQTIFSTTASVARK